MTASGLFGAAFSLTVAFWAAAPKGTKSCRTQGESVRLYVHLSPQPALDALASLWEALASLWEALSSLWGALSSLWGALSSL